MLKLYWYPYLYKWNEFGTKISWVNYNTFDLEVVKNGLLIIWNSVYNLYLLFSIINGGKKI